MGPARLNQQSSSGQTPSCLASAHGLDHPRSLTMPSIHLLGVCWCLISFTRRSEMPLALPE